MSTNLLLVEAKNELENYNTENELSDQSLTLVHATKNKLNEFTLNTGEFMVPLVYNKGITHETKFKKSSKNLYDNFFVFKICTSHENVGKTDSMKSTSKKDPVIGFNIYLYKKDGEPFSELKTDNEEIVKINFLEDGDPEYIDFPEQRIIKIPIEEFKTHDNILVYFVFNINGSKFYKMFSFFVSLPYKARRIK